MKLCKTVIIATSLTISSAAFAMDWNSSPNNYQNSSSNWANSSSNWQNSPNNWQNSPSNYGNKRIVRDNSGNVAGYAVRKSDGGVNIYSFDGTRQGYTPANY